MHGGRGGDRELTRGERRARLEDEAGAGRQPDLPVGLGRGYAELGSGPFAFGTYPLDHRL